jgi:phage shock protein A
MGVLSRFKALFQAQANKALDNLEDPKANLDYSLTRLQDNLRQVGKSLVEVAAAKHTLEAQRDRLAAAATRYEEQARSALARDRDDPAKLALERKQAALARQAELEANIATLERQVESLKTTQANLRTKIELFRSKKEELKAIYDSSQAQLKVRESLSGISEDLTDVGNTIRRAEERIRRMQARAEAIDELIATGDLEDVLEPATDDIDRELSRMARAEAVDSELARLKKEVAAS